MHVKGLVLSKLEKLPDSASFEDVRRELEEAEILEAIEQGEQEADNGNCYTKDDIRNDLKEWTTT